MTGKATTAAGHRRRLRERFQRTGFAGFAEHEILELLLTLCIPRCDVKQPAKRLLTEFGSLRGVLDADAAALQKIPGIGSVAPVALQIIREAATLYLSQSIGDEPIFHGTHRLSDFLRMRFSGLRTECVELLYLDTARRLLPNGIERLETGTVDEVSVIPRKVMENALRHGAKHLVIAHNHPGGSPSFSQADIELTHAVRSAGAPLGIELIDHILIAGNSAISFRSEGLFNHGHLPPLRLVAEPQAPYGKPQ